MDAPDIARIARLERQIAFLYRHLGIDPRLAEQIDVPRDLPPEFTDALRKHNLVLAIKIYRQVTGVSLAEAKAAVERMV
ncbi:hypothetical protein KZZ52_10985 [Dactylosporangium sp. AC04546]|uniref:hypothetical protein n=1 Tax=Dactylosporangium sp. AC04546 TaxID=2862460 RepID=UPI001EDD5D03|nr:hypothetical protein [Dactylosporangium sp. AC04546]WVK85873.1 hypothetical protein KZZ52_10985 [Dactylosporangium sp. AC04546]